MTISKHNQDNLSPAEQIDAEFEAKFPALDFSRDKEGVYTNPVTASTFHTWYTGEIPLTPAVGATDSPVTGPVWRSDYKIGYQNGVLAQSAEIAMLNAKIDSLKSALLSIAISSVRPGTSMSKDDIISWYFSHTLKSMEIAATALSQPMVVPVVDNQDQPVSGDAKQ